MITPLVIFWMSVIPVVIAIKCHQEIPSGIPGTPLYIEADVCAITYSFSKISVKYNLTCQGHFCYMEGHFGGGCLTIVDDSLATFMPAANFYQYLLLKFYLCAEDYCNVVKNNKFRAFKNTMFINKISKAINSTVVPTSSFVAVCENDTCMNRAAEKRLADFSSTKKQISCFSFENAYKRIFEEEDVENKNASDQEKYHCQGDLCYITKSKTVRGCLTIVDDSLSERKVEVRKISTD
ncbi:hypothetical protein PRIPAC_83680 [Pristionchus pacificus]|uniref:DUF7622 domain-containing protein n=1 Tax=Pristionchus pacificus TaxID=54126 RepID=A0A2A6BT18_PRIPA|nr:hypothetical protein PRIPAC_83680 [Pristionchus pacificus]|eukprot:PDM68956.1 hypothetical protein PRIPAC_47258 [Pristionchus pacificus]